MVDSGVMTSFDGPFSSSRPPLLVHSAASSNSTSTSTSLSILPLLQLQNYDSQRSELELSSLTRYRLDEVVDNEDDLMEQTRIKIHGALKPLVSLKVLIIYLHSPFPFQTSFFIIINLNHK